MGMSKVTSYSRYVSFHNCPAFPHGLAVDLDYIGIVDDEVTDSVRQHWIILILMPTWDIHLQAKDGGHYLGISFYQLNDILCFAFFKRIEQPFVLDKQLDLLELLHKFPVGALAVGDGNLYEKSR